MICEWDRYGVRTIYLPPSHAVTAAQSTTAEWRRSSAADRPSPSPDAFSAKSSRAVSHSSCTGRPTIIILSKHCYVVRASRVTASAEKQKSFPRKTSSIAHSAMRITMTSLSLAAGNRALSSSYDRTCGGRTNNNNNTARQ